MDSTPETQPNSSNLLTPVELAARWGLSVHTLENWRSGRRGPEFLKVGRLVRYRLAAVELFERDGLGSAPPAAAAPPPPE